MDSGPESPASISPSGRKRTRNERDNERVFLSNEDLSAVMVEAIANGTMIMIDGDEELQKQQEQEQQQPAEEQTAEEQTAEEQPPEEQPAEAVEESKQDADDNNEDSGPPRKRARRLRRLDEPEPEPESKADTALLAELRDLQDDDPPLEVAMDVNSLENTEEEQPQEEKDSAPAAEGGVGWEGEWGHEEKEEKQESKRSRARRPHQVAEGLFAEQGDANRASSAGGAGGLASLLQALAGVGGNFMDPVRPCPLLSIESKDNDADEKSAEEKYKQYEQALRQSGELQEDDETIAKDMAALDNTIHGALAAYKMNRRFFDLNIDWKPETWCFMCECGQNKEQWEKNRYYGLMVKIIDDGLQKMEPTVLCRKVQMHYNKELRWTLRRKELRDMPWTKAMIWKHITEHAATTRTMLELERINMSSMMNVLANGGIMTVDPATQRKSLDLKNAQAYLTLAQKRDKVMQQLVLLRSNDSF